MTLPLETDQLTKRFGSLTAADRVSVRVERGTIHGLLGPNGSGKSTTLRCALGLLRPDSGGARVFGEPPQRLSHLRGKMGVAFDRPDLLEHATVTQNLDYARRLCGLGRSESRGMIDELVTRVGLDRRLRQRAGTLSLGQKRRLAIARTLLGKPEFVILDEPLSGLDALGVTDMLRFFGELRDEGVTLLLSSHRLNEMEGLVDRVTIMADGKTVADGSLEEVLAGQDRLVVEVDRTELPSGFGPVCDRVDVAEGWTRFELDGAADRADELNAQLVELGCRVRRLQSTRASLANTFENLVRPKTGSDA